MALQHTISLTSVTESISSFSFTLSRSAEAVTLVIFVRTSAGLLDVLIKNVRGFPLSFLVNAGIIPKLVHDHFIPHSNSLFILLLCAI
jgi:hypothetical protein